MLVEHYTVPYFLEQVNPEKNPFLLLLYMALNREQFDAQL